MKKILLITLLLALGHGPLFSQKFGRVDRVYLEAGPVKGTNVLFHYNVYVDRDLLERKDIPLMQPTGLSAGLVIGSKTAQIKGRFLFNSGDISGVNWMEWGVMYGWVTHKRNFAMDVNVGMAYQLVGLEGYYKSRPGYRNIRQVGIISEANLHFSTPYVGISPFVSLNSNIKGISIAVGTKILIGKPGYTKKEFKGPASDT